MCLGAEGLLCKRFQNPDNFPSIDGTIALRQCRTSGVKLFLFLPALQREDMDLIVNCKLIIFILKGAFYCQLHGPE